MDSGDAHPLHGGQLRQIARRFGIASSDLLDFSANINPSGPPPIVLSTLRACLENASMLTEYPDLDETELKSSIARYAGVETSNVVVANGFVPILEATLRALKVGSCLLPVPGFVEYRRTLERAGVEIIPHRLNAECAFGYDSTMLATPAGAVLLANPQNPSGVGHDAGSMRDLVAAASEKNMYVFLDEAFIDYLPENSLSTMIDRLLNLVVFRSVTKFHGMPGLRVAYAIANPALTEPMSENLPPWPITTLAARAVGAALGDAPYAQISRSENLSRRTALKRDLEGCGIAVYPSTANFLLFRLPLGVDPEKFWTYLITRQHIVLRACRNYEGLAPGHFRAAVRTGTENARLVTAVKQALSALQENWFGLPTLRLKS